MMIPLRTFALGPKSAYRLTDAACDCGMASPPAPTAIHLREQFSRAVADGQLRLPTDNERQLVIATVFVLSRPAAPEVAWLANKAALPTLASIHIILKMP
jgi:hypothetical protein